MALLVDDKSAWSSCNLEYKSAAGTFVLTGVSIAAKDTCTALQPDSDVKLPKEDPSAGLKSTSGNSERKGLNGTARNTSMPVLPKSPSCILGIGTATPERTFRMTDFAKDVLHGFGDNNSPLVQEFAARICKNSGIFEKHMAYGRELYDKDQNLKIYGAPSLDKRFELFEIEAMKISTLAAERAVNDWGGDKSKITHLITYSTSGMMSPAIDMRLMKALGLPQTVKHFWVSMMGCHAGLVGIRTAAEIAQADARNRVLVVCVEVNSVQAQSLNPVALKELNNFIVSTIFGDGAAGVVIGTQSTEIETPIFEIDRCQTSYIPDTDHCITAKLTESGLKATLDKSVPFHVSQNSGKFVEQLLQETGLKFDTVNWAVHPGGKAVMEAVEKGCGLVSEQLRWSRFVLENYANMGSPTILFVLDKLRKESHKLPADTQGLIHPWTVVVGFGPGMTMEGILLKIP